MRQLTAAAENLTALTEELGDVDLVLAVYGVEAQLLERLAYGQASTLVERLVKQLMGQMDPGEIRADFAALYTAGVALGLALARELETASPTPYSDDPEGA